MNKQEPSGSCFFVYAIKRLEGRYWFVRYIGQTINPHKRLREHINGSCGSKFGPGNTIKMKIMASYITQLEADKLENQLILKYGFYHKGGELLNERKNHGFRGMTKNERKVRVYSNEPELRAKQLAYERLKYKTDPEYRAKRLARTGARRAKRKQLASQNKERP